MVHGQGCRSRGKIGEGAERNLDAVLRTDVDGFQSVRILLEVRCNFQYDVILVELAEYGGYLALPEGVVERVIDHRRSDAKTAGGIPVDGQRALQSLILLIAGNISQLGQSVQLLLRPWGPMV